MTDILYVLADKAKRGSERELRVSLRSLEKNCKDLGTVYIATDELPDWIDNVYHIESHDTDKRENNAFRKTLIACKVFEKMGAKEFLFMNDDFFMMDSFEAKSYPYFICGDVQFINNPSRYQQVQNNTIFLLNSLGVEKVNDFRCHCPIIYDVDKFLSLEKYYIKIKDSNVGYSPRLLYGNLFVKDYVQEKDCKLWSNEDIRKTKQKCISTSDDADDVLEQIESIFNKKSKYEK